MGRSKLFKRKKSNIRLKAKKKLKLFALKLCVSVFLFAALGGGVYYASQHLEFFKIQNISIEGAEGFITAASVTRDTGVQVGTSLLSVDLEAVAHRLKTQTWIDEVRVSRRFPATLEVKVSLHRPRLLLKQADLYYIDGNGKLFKQLEAGDSKDFPLLTGLSQDLLANHPLEAQKIMQQAVTLLAAYVERGFAETIGISEIHYHPSLGFIVFPEKERLKLIVGFDDFETKVKRLELTLKKLKAMQQPVASIDLNYEGKVVLTLVER